MARSDMGNQHGFTRQKSDRFSGGFTIIEVILFLAISALLLAGAMVGMSVNINNSRFNDAIHSTTSYIQGQYNEVDTGVSNRADNLSCDTEANVSELGDTRHAGMTDCVIMGRYINIEGTHLTTRYIVGYEDPLLDPSDNDTDAIRAMKPRVAGTATYGNAYEVPWGIRVVETKLWNGTSTVAGLAIIHSPASGSVVYYASSTPIGDNQPLGSLFTSSDNINKDVSICLADSGNARYGHITIESGQGQEVIKSDLVSSTGSCS